MGYTGVQCIGFIVDGNRRWARAHNLPTYEGHRRGGEVFNETVRWVREAGIPHAVYYLFSTENWQRSEAEVSYLLDLFREWIDKLNETAEKESFKVRFVGRREDFPADLQERMSRVEAENVQRPPSGTTIWLALSYGGRAEILAAVNEVVRRGEVVTEETFAQLLWSADMPDPDIIVRTGGEQRLSNFMTWRSVYSELLFLEQGWPALTKADFDGILKTYENRERRKGK